MLKRRISATITLAAILGVASFAHAETPDELRNRILTETKVVAIMDLAVPSAEFKGDGDPSTLEIVFLSKKSDGPNRVSDDGEVIFLYKPSDKLQEQLIARAFEIRIARAAGGT